jgi:hypothetical protein
MVDVRIETCSGSGTLVPSSTANSASRVSIQSSAWAKAASDAFANKRSIFPK